MILLYDSGKAQFMSLVGALGSPTLKIKKERGGFQGEENQARRISFKEHKLDFKCACASKDLDLKHFK